MSSMYCNAAAFAVAILYYFWRAHRHLLDRKRRQVRERVAYMLWVMAHGGEEYEPSCPSV
jgi:hypothetical protein